MDEEGKKHLDPLIVARIEQSDRDGGVFLKEPSPGSKLDVYTKNSCYEIEVIDGEKGQVKIKGGRSFLDWETITISGSTWGGSMLKINFIGIGMRLELYRKGGGDILTSTINEIWKKKVDCTCDAGERGKQ